MAFNDVITRIRAKNEVDAGIRAADRSIGGFARRTAGLFKGLIGPIAALGGAAGIGLVSKRMIEAGSSAIETRSKFESVFGPEGVAQMDQFNEEFGRLAGISQVNLQEVVATTGAIAQGMGFSTVASAEFAREITTLAGDLTSFNNIPIEQTSRAIQSALTGERESLKRLGIVIKQTDVDQRALQQSGKTLTSQLTDQERATATLALITERAGAAVGDLERTQDSAANRMRRIKSTLQDIGNTISVAVIPALEAMLPLIQEFADTISENLPKAANFFKNLAGAIGIVDTEVLALQESIRGIQTVEIAERRQIDIRERMQEATDNLAAAEQRLLDMNAFQKLTPTASLLRQEIENLAREVELLGVEEEAAITRVNELSAAREREAQATRDAAAATREAADAARIAAFAMPEPQIAPVGEGPQLRGVEGRPEILPTPERIQATTQAMMQFQLAFVESLDPVQEFVDATLTLDETMGRLAGETLVNLGAAFNDAFSAIGAGEPVFKAISTAIKRSIAETAAAEGRLEFARGTAKIAAGIFPPNPAAIASGLKHFAAGALFSAIGGALGGGQGGGRGGGAGGGFTGRNELRPTEDPFAPQREITVNLQGSNFLDFNDPRQRDAFASMFGELGADRVIVTDVGEG